ncbi:hypothetical protein [Spirillospora sp. NBC_01491]|uniref:hypothetical protein n=1 Tax=Spirillospora sp. NBC_01491 TaxID=2976007 RepID=UPI002E2FF5D7|nr:hypothetical protein [Spirillospora sp. NBC_01491]
MPNGDQLVVDDYTPAGGWRVRASVQKYNSGKDAWQALFSCTAKEGQSVPTKCAQDIPEGTLVRVHVWMYEGSNTKWDAYSATTHA